MPMVKRTAHHCRYTLASILRQAEKHLLVELRRKLQYVVGDTIGKLSATTYTHGKTLSIKLAYLLHSKTNKQCQLPGDLQVWYFLYNLKYQHF